MPATSTTPATSIRATPHNPTVPPPHSDKHFFPRPENEAAQEGLSRMQQEPNTTVWRTSNLQPVQNRVEVLLVHIPKLSIRGQARLAAEVGVSRSTVSRLVNGRINPSYRLARGVTTVLERLLGYPLDMRDVFSTDGTYLTPSDCVLCRCGGCLPDRAYDLDGNLRPDWRGQRPGDWSLTKPAEAGPTAGPVIDASPTNIPNINIPDVNILNAKEAR